MTFFFFKYFSAIAVDPAANSPEAGDLPFFFFTFHLQAIGKNNFYILFMF